MELYDLVKKLLDYNSKTGVFTWKENRGSNKVKGLQVNNINYKGYLIVRLNCKTYLAHRLAWLYVYGESPKGQIDHINGIKDDNRIENLRDVTNRQNSQNRVRHKSGKLVGVHYHKASKKFQVECWLQDKKIYLGLFETEILGHEAYIKFCKENNLL